MSTIIRSLITVLMFSSFIALWVYVWRKENKARYDDAAQLPLSERADALEPNILSRIQSNQDSAS